MDRTQRSSLLMVILAGTIPVCTFAQTAATLKTRFESLLGNQKWVRMVWQRQSGELPSNGFTGSTTIMAFDSYTGEVWTLVGGTDNKTDATFTWDGRRVVYVNNTNGTVYVTDFGKNTTPKVVISGGFKGAGHCWRSADGKDYVLACKGARLYKINIDNKADSTFLISSSNLAEGVGVTWASMSTDGNYVAGAFPIFPDVGVFPVSTKSITKFSPGGCWPTIARDNSYDVLYTIEPHQSIRIVNKSGGQVLQKNLGNAIHSDGDITEYECLRWTPERDFITLISYNEEGGTCRNISNPRLVKVSTLQFAAVVDAPTGSEGNTDAFFYTDPVSVSVPSRGPSGQRTVSPLLQSAGEEYNTMGRDISGLRRIPGVSIRKEGSRVGRSTLTAKDSDR